jgi:tetratricopeptide (TPR) repeat protein
LAIVIDGQGRREEALSLFKQALAMKIRAVGEIHPDVALSMTNVALALNKLEKTEEAVQKNRRAIEILLKTVGPDHPALANLLANGAEFAGALGKNDEAKELAERAIAIMERELGPDHLDLAFPLTALGSALVALDQPVVAIPTLERALLILETRGHEPLRLAETRFALARALSKAKATEGPRALAEARAALGLVEGTKQGTKLQAGIEAWLIAHHSNEKLSMR